MSSKELSGTDWYVKLEPKHFHYCKRLAKIAGDTERGAEARQARRLLNTLLAEDTSKCPKCGSSNVEETTGGMFEYCLDCGHVVDLQEKGKVE